MRNYRISKAAACISAALLLVSCGKSARIDGTINDLPDGDVIVKLLDINTYSVLDTVVTDGGGKFSYKVHVEPGQPEFVYLYHGDTKIASLLLSEGDKVTVSADTTGRFSVEGSEESAKLAGIEKEFSEFSSRMEALSVRLSGLDASSEEAAAVRKDMGKAYTDYYRSRVKYVMENPHSLTVVPVLYQTVADNLPVFGQRTDAIHFNNICDSLSSVYPDSKYVKALKQEAKRRTDLLSLSIRLENAPQMSYPDLELPDVNSQKVRLSEVGSKVVLLHFWTASDAAQKMFNLDVLKPLYKEFHARGLEIYQVALDQDKAMWARTVKDQGLEWINVCDGLGASSPAILLYNLGSLPVTFLISDGELVKGDISDTASLRRLVRSQLR